MKARALFILSACSVAMGQAQPIQHGPLLYCHRTANEDAPENTLASLEQAALLGCNVVEIDLRRTLDGEIVLNHDGLLDRLTDGHGDVEQTNFAELQLLDAGAWMAPRFTGMRMARFDDALRLARSLDIRLILDIKTKGIGADVLRILEREGMIDHVLFNGEWDDIRRMLPSAADAGYGAAWVQPGVTAAEVASQQRQGKSVIANFSANSHGMDLAGMKAAVAAGVDAINVDFPRLGADAVGRDVESKIRRLKEQAQTGDDAARSQAILKLSRYQDPDLQSWFLRWLDNPSPRISHTAALALLLARPALTSGQLTSAARANNAAARANAAWLLGQLGSAAADLVPMLSDPDPGVQLEALRALGRTKGDAPIDAILPFFQSSDVNLRGAAALALAHTRPNGAAKVISAQLQKEIDRERSLAEGYVAGGRKNITPEQIREATSSFRAQMAMLHALSSLHDADATSALVHVAFQPVHEFAQTDSVVGCFQLWDRIGDDPTIVVQQLSSTNQASANCAEWALVKADIRVLPTVRDALNTPSARVRAIRILAWHGDADALLAVQKIAHAAGPEKDLAAWAAEKIQILNAPKD
ncbi:glycerophosphodiester phosphodiesterase family protein [Granulicella sibirica]|uniref:Glycerophosphoryl diester phosphodiesterase n=1 Tax=Granulicella sibirica TaxID=2479048 RepID=A0A4Q0STC8_9BACT|nr:glycerophosphodiester phosphodiesterase family protein [Granulicella sibirica]RXH54203.1 Glycerophosphoryl diester phosphodiesterase [Granulicella sibirica]